MTNLEKYNEAFTTVFSVSAKDLNDEFNAGNIDSWDSVHQLSIVAQCILSYFSCSGSFCVRLFLPCGGDLVVVREFRTSRETALGGGDRGESRGGGILRRAVVQVVFHTVDDRVGLLVAGVNACRP